MTNAPDMTSKTVLITGASRGIGAEAARIFAEAGANLVLMARSEDALREVAAKFLGDTNLGPHKQEQEHQQQQQLL
jgi:short-subunit dehydrogenase